MDGGNTAYYYIASVLVLSVFLIIKEFKRK
jgi:hypothetical protein